MREAKLAVGSMVAALVVASIAYSSLGVYEDLRLTATTLVALGGTLIGFMLASLSLLIGVSDRDFMRNLRRTGHLPRLVDSIFHVAGLWLAVIVSGLAAHLAAGHWQRILVALSMGLTVIAFAYLIRLGRRYFLVIRVLGSS